jgi:hypothetical protein
MHTTKENLEKLKTEFAPIKWMIQKSKPSINEAKEGYHHYSYEFKGRINHSMVTSIQNLMSKGYKANSENTFGVSWSNNEDYYSVTCSFGKTKSTANSVTMYYTKLIAD